MLKKLLSLLITFIIFFSPVLLEAKSSRTSYGKSSYKSQGTTYRSYNSRHYGSSYKSKSYRTHKYTSYPKTTYKIGKTKYNYSERYKSSGLPKVDRSESAKKQFLKSRGYKKVPPGYEVDHIIPLSKGGRDEPSNMQLIPNSLHKQKTASEKRR